MAKTIAYAPIIGGGTGAAAAPTAVARDQRSLKPYGALLAIGLTLGTVGWTDVLLNLFPGAIGNPDWEVGTVSITVDALPLGSLGLGLAIFGASVGRRMRALQSLAFLAWGGAAFLVAAAVIFGLALPSVWGVLPDQMRAPFALASLKTGVLGSIYLAYHVWLGAFAWKHGRWLREGSG